VNGATGAPSEQEEGVCVKYVILIHANPDPWGHPTSIHTPQGRAVPPEQHQEMDRQFDELLEELTASGEFVTAEALADPASATLYGWSPEGHLATDGPYAEAKEQLAGFFIIDCDSRQRAEEVAARFAQPGDVVELRPVMGSGADDR
jgi:hypothetical protein